MINEEKSPIEKAPKLRLKTTATIIRDGRKTKVEVGIYSAGCTTEQLELAGALTLQFLDRDDQPMNVKKGGVKLISMVIEPSNQIPQTAFGLKEVKYWKKAEKKIRDYRNQPDLMISLPYRPSQVKHIILDFENEEGGTKYSW